VTKILTEEIAAFGGAWLARVPIGDVLGEGLPGWSSLLGDERDFARGCKPLRHREFVAGRAALHAARQAAGWTDRAALLPRLSGAPDLPEDFTASITHKEGFAFAIARPLVGDSTLGVDCEVVGTRDRSGIARKILRPAEHKRWRDSGERWPTLVELFSVKEAIYKALTPHVPRYIGFEEAEIHPGGRIQLHLSKGEGPFLLRSALRWEGGRLLAFVEARPGE
jgi:4'-phosphopantetheinyl transferase EntD